MNKLEQIKKYTQVVIDTGDIDAVKKYSPVDATTNPSLILAAAEKPEYSHLIDEAVHFCKEKAFSSEDQKSLLIDRVFVNFGKEILKSVPGRVSTEVDARLSFDKEKSVQKARYLIQLYEKSGVSRDRVLIKLASTWEGAAAARELEKEGIHVNMTLLFSLPQAAIAADAGVTLISPFVGRILDWYKKDEGVEQYAPSDDPGVKSVTLIYHYLKKYQYSTQVMGASFRNVEEILELVGCDLLTISPKFLEQLQQEVGEVPRKLEIKESQKCDLPKLSLSESQFRLMLNENAMATEKLAEGIRLFAKDSMKLEKSLLDRLNR